MYSFWKEPQRLNNPYLKSGYKEISEGSLSVPSKVHASELKGIFVAYMKDFKACHVSFRKSRQPPEPASGERRCAFQAGSQGHLPRVPWSASAVL